MGPMWSVSTIITGLISFMVETAPTLGSIETSTFQKKKLASKSLEYNVTQKTFCKLFPELVQLQEEIELRKRELGLTSSSSSSSSSTTNNERNEITRVGGDGNLGGEGMVQSLMALFAGFVALLSILFAMR